MVINGNIFNYIFPKTLHRKGLRDTNAVMTMKKQKMKRRKMKRRTVKRRTVKNLTLRDLLSLHKIDLHIDWNYWIKATKSCDTRPDLQEEQWELKAYGCTPIKIIQTVNNQ